MLKAIVKCAVSLLVVGTLAAGPVFADKPDRSGDGHHEKGQKKQKKQKKEKREHEARDDDRDRRGGGDRKFADQHRAVVHDYYDERFRTGKCPPGLAKKNNGCMPPGQAKKWRVGRPLPRDVVYYELPAPLVVELGPPPPQHRYVRVAADILLIAVGTSMVVDAIQDLGRM